MLFQYLVLLLIAFITIEINYLCDCTLSDGCKLNDVGTMSAVFTSVSLTSNLGLVSIC